MRKAQAHRYVGLDLSDRYAKTPRTSDVCVMTVEAGRLVASWHTWPWPATGDLAESLLGCVGEYRTLFIDGPQALARPGSSVRESEVLVKAPGRTPDHRPVGSKPFYGFIRSGLDLFDSLRSVGLKVGDSSKVGIHEVFPGAIWEALAQQKLAAKGRAEGRRQRASLLMGFGVVGIPRDATHDQLDACAAALLGAAVDGHVLGLSAGRAGTEAWWDDVAKTMREGVILTAERGRVVQAATGGVMADEYRCPIAGCKKMFHGTRGGWDAHVESLKNHSSWNPTIKDKHERKRLFRLEFPQFFGGAGPKEAGDGYTLAEHRHRFACWAAGRAASVSTCRFTVAEAVSIIEAIGLDRCCARVDALPTPAEIDKKHREWRAAAIKAGKRQFGIEMSHGVAAKLINVYLKSCLVCGGRAEHTNVAALHPPIDSVLLAALKRADVGGQSAVWATAARQRWSRFDSGQYETVIGAIRASLGQGVPLWKIEAHWQGHR